MKIILIVLCFILVGCVRIPENIQPIDDFQVQRYLGKWHEIARLDHSFEKGLTKVTADYSLRDDTGIKVINRGYSAEDNRWEEAEGRAYFVEDPNQGYLRVSFFGPFYGSYIIFELDKVGYQYALVCGPDKSYLWILARTPRISEALKETLIAKARALGFDTSKLILVEQD